MDSPPPLNHLTINSRRIGGNKQLDAYGQWQWKIFDARSDTCSGLLAASYVMYLLCNGLLGVSTEMCIYIMDNVNYDASLIQYLLKSKGLNLDQSILQGITKFN